MQKVFSLRIGSSRFAAEGGEIAVRSGAQPKHNKGHASADIFMLQSRLLEGDRICCFRKNENKAIVYVMESLEARVWCRCTRWDRMTR